PKMSGNGSNPHSLRDLLGTYEKSGLESQLWSEFAPTLRGSALMSPLIPQTNFSSAQSCKSAGPKLGKNNKRYMLVSFVANS
ncbi:hypothetical protein, partial [Marinobacter goseongensis]|uniref:hypothetical protein n=1 Tax=Marinobacter goseongensis TaxID=453838 RepID=UPI002004ADE0